MKKIVVAAALAVACSSSSPAQNDAGTAANTITFTMKQTVKAGTELFGCMYVQPSVDRTFFTKVAHKFTPGSHHVVLLPTDLTSIPAGQDTVHDCYAGGADFMSHARGFMYASQTPEDSFDLPKGVAFFADPSAVYLLQSHYLNAGASDLDATVTVTLTTSDGNDIGTKAGTLFFYDPSIYVPKGGTGSAGMRCPIPQDITLIRVIPHTHARGTAVSAFLDPASGAPAAQPFYTSTDWEHPAPSPPPMSVAAGSHVRFRCDYANANGSQDYYQGLSALTNEMCVFGGVYYPDMGLLVNGCSGADQFGVGNKTCGDTLDCLLGCLSLTDPTENDHCGQTCRAASCVGAGPAIVTGGKCAQASCSDACKLGSNKTACSDCLNAMCAAEVAACRSNTCQ